MSQDSIYERGMKVRREVLSDEHVDKAIANTNSFDADFQTFITNTAWGDVWSRPGLDRKTRSIITLTSLLALGHEKEFKMHCKAAIRNGLSTAEISEVILHASIYCGVPAANSAIAAAKEVLAEEIAKAEKA
jgi:4-carboxymuconolactone decarboxylase